MADTKPTFDELLQNLHSGAQSKDDNESLVIEVTDSRQFKLPEGFEKTIAYEGDVNSQIITFKLPSTADGHPLKLCGNKKLRWINMSSGNEGSSKLTMPTSTDDFILTWAPPAEAFTKAGQLRFSISIYDLTKEGQVAYSWNTAECSELSVGASLEDVSPRGEDDDEYIPAKNEILVINTEKRTISAPVGYQHTICNYGDVDTSVVYFQIKRYLRGIDVLEANINIYARMDNVLVTNKSTDASGAPSKELYAVDLNNRDGEGLVNIVWKPTQAITANQAFYTGKFKIQIEIVSGSKKWRTSVYDDLSIGASDMAFNIEGLPETDEDGKEIAGYIINGDADMTDLSVKTVAGLVTLRSCTPLYPIWVNKNELVVEYQDNGEYIGVRIGTKAGGQSSLEAPFVATNPSMTILLQGGST